MSTQLGSDAVLALRRLRRSLTWWRLLAVAGFAVAVLVSVRDSGFVPAEAHVARVEIDGLITGDEPLIDVLDALTKDPTAKAVIVEISSPGGTFTGGDRVFEALRRISDAKPVVGVMGDIATSGAYMTAIATDRIFAGQGTITGSIGVIMQSADVTGLLDKIGVKPEIVKSGSLKATPNPAEKFTPDARAQIQSVIDELHLHFMKMVAARRGLSVDQVRARTGDGRIMTASSALDAGLIDAIGDIDNARAWLADARGIDPALPLIDWEPDDGLTWWERSMAGASAALFGKSLLTESLRLDGMLALWHPSWSAGR